EPELGARLWALRRALVLRAREDERTVDVVARGSEGAVAGSFDRLLRRHLREHPLERTQLPGRAAMDVDEDRRLANVEPLHLWIQEVVAHARDHPRDDLVAVRLRPSEVGRVLRGRNV